MSARTLSWLSLPCALVLLAGCPSPTPAPEVKAPKIVSFSASPADLGTEGGLVTLTWDTEDATSVVVTDSHRGAISGAVDPDGTVKVEVDRTTLFVLTAQGEEDRTVTAVAQVRAGPPDAELVLIAQPSVVKKGGAVTLAWAATEPSGLKLSTVDGAVIDVGTQTTTGSVTVYPEANTTYVLEAAGRRAEASVQIKASIESFAVTPASAIPGQPLTFSWKTTGASKITLEEANGEVLTTTEAEADVASGSFVLPIPVTVSNDRVFNFRLRAEGGTSGVVAEELVTVYLAGQSHILTFELPPYARAGGTFTARWSTAQADEVVLLADGAVVYRSLDTQVAKAGTVELPTPSARTTYELRAINNRGGQASTFRSLAPVVATQVKSALATPGTIAQGGDPVTLQWDIEGARKVRVVHSVDGLVFTGSGDSMQTHSLTVLPNASGSYEIIADNTLGEYVVARVPVTVTQPAVFSLGNTGTIFVGESLTLTAPTVAGASGFVGFPHSEVDVSTGAAATEFIDISNTGTVAPFIGTADKANLRLNLDFETSLFGELVGGEVVIFSDGFLVFGPWAKTRDDNLPIPGAGLEPFLVAPFWDDLVFGPNSAVLYEVRGEAPNKTLIVQWNEVQVKNDLASALTFQAQVQQTGELKFVYTKLQAPTASPTIGVQGQTAARGVVYGTALNEGEALTLFGARSGPLTITAHEAGPFSAFIKSGDAYLRVPLVLERFLAVGDLTITEAMPSPDAALGNPGQWVEVANLSAAPVDLAGWTLQSEQGSFVISAGANQRTVVDPGGVLVLGASQDPAQNGGVTVDSTFAPSFALSNTASFVTLSNGAYVSQRAWTSPQPGVSEVFDTGKFLALGETTGIAHEVSCKGTASFGAPVTQLGTPGVLKGCFGYRVVSRPVHYRDISLTGQPVLSTGTSKLVSVAGTGTKVFGVPLNTLNVALNGYVTFNTNAASSYDFSALKAPTAATPNATATLLGRYISRSDAWDSNVYLQRIAAGEDLLSPMGHWIVQWHKLSTSGLSLDSFNFQLKIFDDGSLEYHYGDMASADSNEYGRGTGSVIWLENPAGTLALPLSMYQPLIRPNSAYRFIAE